MAAPGKNLSSLLDIEDDSLKLDHKLLKDRAADTLRDYISTGRIPEGTKLTEREVSRLLGIGRAPTRDALMILEGEGLVVSKPDGRYVIELTEKDVRDILVLRVTLERLAVELAAANASEENRAALHASLGALEETVASGDRAACTKADMALHRTIWHQADNPQLLRVLDSVLGAIFVLADRVKIYGDEDLQRMFGGHRKLVDQITAGDSVSAARTIEGHLKSSLAQSLRTFQAPHRERTEDD